MVEQRAKRAISRDHARRNHRWSSSQRSERSVETTPRRTTGVEQRANRAISRDHAPADRLRRKTVVTSPSRQQVHLRPASLRPVNFRLLGSVGVTRASLASRPAPLRSSGQLPPARLRLGSPAAAGSGRRRVAATVAMARTPRPTASRARWASRAVAPVVRTSSHTTTCAAGRRRARRRRASPRHRIEPSRLAHRWPASRPAWSPTWPATASSRCRDAGRPAAQSRATAASTRAEVTSRPRARTTDGRDGTGTSTSGPTRSAVAASTAAASSAPKRPAQRPQPTLLVTDDHGADRAGVLARRPRLGEPGRRRGRPDRHRARMHRVAAVEAEQAARALARDARRAEQQVDGGVAQSGANGHRASPAAAPAALKGGGSGCGRAPQPVYVSVDRVTSENPVVRTVRERSVKLSGVATSSGVPASGEPTSQR